MTSSLDLRGSGQFGDTLERCPRNLFSSDPMLHPPVGQFSIQGKDH